jgi:hypothetical protein
MAFINVNFNDVPDDFKTLEAGEYNLEISSCEIQPTKSGSSQNLVVDFKVADGEFAGRKMKEWFYLGNEMGLIKVKKFLVACGCVPGPEGINTEELLGKICKAVIVERNYKDDITGEDKKSSEIKSFLC